MAALCSNDNIIEGVQATEAGGQLAFAGPLAILFPEGVAMGGIKTVASGFQLGGDETI